MRVTILGAGDTTGTPTPGCSCDTCTAARDRGVERSRFSVLVEGPEGALLIDASPDLRHQLLDNDVPVPDAATVTHVHFDHLDGLGNAYRLVDSLPVHAANETDPTTGESVADTIRRKYDYLDRVSVHDAAPHEPIRVCGLDCTLVPVDHPPLLCYGVVVDDPETGGRLAISGDTTYDVPERSREALSGADLLFADGIVPASMCAHHPKGGRHHVDGVPMTFGTKHMTREGALRFADDCRADRVRIVHVSHFYGADEAFAEPLAVDGETCTV
jgi:phosphoribosyl 1,2-cyclic phosphate phosphodiesterase